MDFEEMSRAMSRATADNNASAMAIVKPISPDQLDDLNQRLLDRHAVNWDLLCVEASTALSMLRDQLDEEGRRYMELVSVLANTAAALESAFIKLSEATSGFNIYTEPTIHYGYSVVLQNTAQQLSNLGLTDNA